MYLLESIWNETTHRHAFPALDGDRKTDVLIIGGGLAGLLIARELHLAGVNYLLIEAERICGGVTKNTTAKVTSQHGLIYHKLTQRFDRDTARTYWQANEAALERIRSLCDTIQCEFENKDNYIYSLDRPDCLERELNALEQAGIPADYVKDLPLPAATAGAVRFRDQGQFHPLKFVMGFAPSLNICENTRALAFKGRNVVQTQRGTIQAESIIVATHFPIFNKHGGYFLKMYQERSYVLALDGGQRLDGMYLEEGEQGLSLRNYGPYLLLGGGDHRTGKQGGGWRELEQFGRQHYPQAKVCFRWATQDCMTLDDIPYIGPYSKNTPTVYVATGFNKWGMTSAMVSAMLLSDLVQGKENDFAQVFSPARSSLRPQLALNVLESASGLLRLSRPRCPHLGCALKWNRQERSWDCPCHGSRFSEHGRLLDGPANADMKQP